MIDIKAWLRKIFHRPTTPLRRQRPMQRTARPTLERLEDRLAPALNFAPHLDYSVAADNDPYVVIVANLDTGSVLDVATASANSHNVTVFLGNGDGTLGTASNFDAGAVNYSVAAADFDGDSDADLATANIDANTVSVLEGNNTGNFLAPVPPFPSTGTSPYSLATGFFNADTDADIVTANANSDNVSVFMGNGDGTFASAANFGVGALPVSVIAEDLNNDGFDDIVTADMNSNTVTVLLNNGAGTFSPLFYGVGTSPLSVTAGYFNNDLFLDLATANYGSSDVTIMLNNGNGSFGVLPAISNPLAEARSISTGDFDGDGSTDLVTANSNLDNVSVFLGHGDGTFDAPVHFDVDIGPYSVTAGDLNGDGLDDLVTANALSDTVSILLNTSAPPYLIAAGGSGVTIPEGTSTGNLLLAIFSNPNDPSGTLLAPAGFSATITWQDGNTDTATIANGGIVNNGDGTFSVFGNNFYVDDNPTNTSADPYLVDVAISHPATADVHATTTITVNDVAPQITSLISSGGVINENDTFTLSGAFHDDGIEDTHTIVIDWNALGNIGGAGEGTTTLTTAGPNPAGASVTSLGNGNWTFSADHLFLDDNPTATPQDSYKVTVTIIDDDLLNNNGFAPAGAAGLIFVNHDEWTFGGLGFANAADTPQFALNLGDYFTAGATGNFLVYSSNFGLTGSELASTMTGAGHSWTVSTTTPFTLANLLNYNAIFLGGNPFAYSSSVLIDYVNAGGNVYLMAGTGAGGAATEAATWDPFLLHFGLDYAPAYNGITGTFPIFSSHPIFNGVSALFSSSGNTIIDLDAADPSGQIVAFHNGQGVYAIANSIVPASVTVVVHNLAPILTSLNLSNTAIFTGDTAILSGAFTDVGSLDTHIVNVSWGDGSPDTTFSLGVGVFSFSGIGHQYLTPQGTPYNITVTIADDDTASDSASIEITVVDSIIVNPGPEICVEENCSTGLILLASFMDLAGPQPLSAYNVTADWGDGTSVDSTTDAMPNIFIVQTTANRYLVLASHYFAYASPIEDFTVTTTIHFLTSTGAMVDTMVTSEVCISNPSVSATGMFHINALEGLSTGMQTVATFKDPSGARLDASGVPAAGEYSATIDWGNLGPTTQGIITYNGGTLTVKGSNVYGEPGLYTVSILLQHTTASNVTVVSYADVANQQIIGLGMGPLNNVDQGSPTGPLSAIALFNDPGTPGSGDFTAYINWDDGHYSPATVSYVGLGVYQVNAPSHTYHTAGTYTITTTVQHDNLAPVRTTRPIRVNDPAIIGQGVTFVAVEGQLFNGVVGNFTDPGSTECCACDYTATINWGDGGSSPGTITFANGAFVVSGSYTYCEVGTFTVSIYINQGSQITRLSGTPVPAFVGPNDFGYAAYDRPLKSFNMSGAFSIIEASDDAFAVVDLGASTFTYYGTTYSSLYVTSNGLISFGGSTTAWSNTDLSTSPGNPTIAAFWDDLAPTGSNSPADPMVSAQYVDDNQDGTAEGLILQWHTKNLLALNGSDITFQAVLELNTGATAGNIFLNYVDLNFGDIILDNGASATVAIRNDSGSGADLLPISFNNAGSHVTTGNAILISTQPPLTAGIPITVSDPQLTNLASANLPAVGFVGTPLMPIVGIATFVDPGFCGDDTTDDFTATIDWGDGTTSPGTIVSNGDGTYRVDALAHTYSEAGTYRVIGILAVVAIPDFMTPIQTIDIGEGALIAGLLTAPDASVGVAFNDLLLFHFIDTNPSGEASNYTAVITWGDGTTTSVTSVPSEAGRIVANSAGGFDVLGSHMYTDELSNVEFIVVVTGRAKRTEASIVMSVWAFRDRFMREDAPNLGSSYFFPTGSSVGTIAIKNGMAEAGPTVSRAIVKNPPIIWMDKYPPMLIELMIVVAMYDHPTAGAGVTFGPLGGGNYLLGMVHYNGSSFDVYIFEAIEATGNVGIGTTRYKQLAFAPLPAALFNGTGPLGFERTGNQLKLFVNRTLVLACLVPDGYSTSPQYVGMRGQNVQILDLKVSSTPIKTAELSYEANFNNAPYAPNLDPVWAGEVGAFTIVNQKAVVPSFAGVSIVTLNTTPVADAIVRTNIDVTTVGAHAGLVARYSGPGQRNFYTALVHHNPNGTYVLYVFVNVNGAFTQLAVKNLPGFSGTGDLRFEVVGNQLKSFINGVLTTVTYNSALTAPGKVGIRGFLNAAFDNFSADAVPAPTTAVPFTDSFTKANNSTLDRVWTERAGAFSIQGNRAADAANLAGVSLATLSTGPLASVGVQAEVTLNAISSGAGLITRYSASGYYLAMLYNDNGNYKAYIFLCQGGRFTQLAVQTLPGFAGTGTLRFEASGASLKLFVNGVQKAWAMNSALTNGLVGMRSFNASFDDPNVS